MSLARECLYLPFDSIFRARFLLFLWPVLTKSEESRLLILTLRFIWDIVSLHFLSIPPRTLL